MLDTSGIHRVIAQARTRLKTQSAIEAATVALVLASVAAMCVVFAMRHDAVSTGTGIGLLVGCAGLVFLGAGIGAARRFPSRVVATRVDRASGLSDRLASACAFEDRLAAAADEPEETVAMMRAAVADAASAVPRADVKAATVFAPPPDTRAALAFAVVAAAVAGLWWPDDKCAADPGDPSSSTAALSAESGDDAVDLDDEDIEYTRDLLDDLRRTADSDQDLSLQEFVRDVEELLEKAELGELTKEELLEELAKAEEEYGKNTDVHVEETVEDLKQTGKELKKNKLTKELGKALEKGDLEKAQQEMEQLAKKLENNELSEKQRQQVAKALEKASDKFEKKEQKKGDKLDKQIEQKKKEIAKLKRKFDKSKSDSEKQRLSRRMKRKNRDLKRLKRKKEERKKSTSRRSLKQLHRNLKNAAQEMRKENNAKSRRQASRKMKAASRNVGRVQKDARKVATKRKVASQLTDLKEALRRAKRKGGRGPKDLFGRNKKNRDFGRRARGGKGSKGAWKPGSCKGGGLGKGKQGGQAQNANKPGGKGKGKGGDTWGTGTDPNLTGDPTGKGGHITDKKVTGVHGRGPSKRETVLAAAQKGFASRQYKKVYAAYKAIVEEVMHTEKVPAGYKYYIKRYFQKIKPHSMD